MSQGKLFRSATRLGALIGSVSLSSLAVAQTASPSPARSVVDANGVNLATGKLEVTDRDLTIGAQGASGLAHVRYWTGDGWRHGLFASAAVDGSTVTIAVGGQTTSFTESGGNYTASQGSGATLSATSGSYIYTAPDGTQITFDRTLAVSDSSYYGPFAALATLMVLPSGERLTLTYKAGTYTQGATYTVYRLQSVASSAGYQLKYKYATDSLSISTVADWRRIADVTAINNTVDYCDPNADTCSFSQTWPQVTYSKVNETTEQVIDAADQRTTYIRDGSARLSQVTRPGNASVAVTYDGNNRIATIGTYLNTFTYSWSLSGTTLTATVADQLSRQRNYTSDTDKGVLLSEQDAIGRTTSYQYDANGRLTLAIAPEGNKVQYTYDSRGNLTETRAISKSPGTPTDIVTTAAYPSSCSNPKTCNKPTSTTDAKGNVTDYTYDAAHGGALTVTAPATPNSVRPQTRYAYFPYYGYYKDASGAIVQGPAPIYKMTSISACRTLAVCGEDDDLTITRFAYGPQSAGTGNNLLPRTVTTGAFEGGRAEHDRNII